MLYERSLSYRAKVLKAFSILVLLLVVIDILVLIYLWVLIHMSLILVILIQLALSYNHELPFVMHILSFVILLNFILGSKISLVFN